MAQSLDTNLHHARAYAWLKAMLIDYRFGPGEHLRIANLASRLNLSATPVRESLIRLQEESLVDAIPGRGFYAKTLNLREMLDLYELRFVLAKHTIERHIGAANLSIIHLPQQQRDTSRCNGARNGGAIGQEIVYEKVKDHAEYVEKIYDRIASISKNRTMTNLARNVNERTHYVRTIDMEASPRLKEIVRNVEEVVSALQCRDAMRAISILERELQSQLEVMPDVVREGLGRACASRQSEIAAPSRC